VKLPSVELIAFLTDGMPAQSGFYEQLSSTYLPRFSFHHEVGLTARSCGIKTAVGKISIALESILIIYRKD